MKYRNTKLVLWLALVLCLTPVYLSPFLPEWVLRVYAGMWIGLGVSNEWVRRRAEERRAVRFAETRMHLDGLFKRDVQ